MKYITLIKKETLLKLKINESNQVIDTQFVGTCLDLRNIDYHITETMTNNADNMISKLLSKGWKKFNV